MELGLDIRQTQTLSPQMMRAMEILQMGSQELLEYIEETLQENPVLESESMDDGEDITQLRRKLDWLESTDIQNRWYHQQDAQDSYDPLEQAAADPMEESLYYYLRSQVRFEQLPQETAQILDYMMLALDANGWLTEQVDDLCARFGVDSETVERILDMLQGLEPSGVGARDLRECLRLQLLRRDETGLALTIVEHYLEDMSRDHYHHIAKETGTGRLEVQSACKLIRSLNPRPASGFADREHLQYITPDLVVVNFEDHFEILTNDSYLPSLRINGYYSQLYQETGDHQVKDYLNQKLRQAKWVMRSVEQRRSTLMRCAQCIVDRQEDFFRHGPGHLHPMLLMDVAGELEVHESTVSRAVKDKYIQCAHGLYPLGYFFSRSLGADIMNEGVTPETVKKLLQELIDEEDKSKPFSDQKLADQLAARGVELSRRTVAKYRDELGISSTSGRKIFREKGK